MRGKWRIRRYKWRQSHRLVQRRRQSLRCTSRPSRPVLLLNTGIRSVGHGEEKLPARDDVSSDLPLDIINVYNKFSPLCVADMPVGLGVPSALSRFPDVSERALVPAGLGWTRLNISGRVQEAGRAGPCRRGRAAMLRARRATPTSRHRRDIVNHPTE